MAQVVDVSPVWNMLSRTMETLNSVEVWKVKATQLASRCSVLMEAINVSSLPDDESRLLDELKTWKSCHHPNIRQLIDFRVEMGSLQVHLILPLHKRMEDYLLHADYHADRLRLCKDVAAGIGYLHSRGIVHGDIRGANILVDDDGDRAMLADFGISNMLEASNKSESLDNVSKSWRWTAPEVINHGGSMLTTASDVWAFSCTCYEIFTHDLPFAEITSEVDVLLGIHALKHPPRPTPGHPAIRRGLEDHMWEIMLLCWAPSPTHRPDIHVIHESIMSPTQGAKHSEQAIHEIAGGGQVNASGKFCDLRMAARL